MNPFNIQKKRELFFADGSDEQLVQAYTLLSGLDNLSVIKGSLPNSLIIQYSLLHYSLEGLEKALIKQGFRFRDTWRDRLYKLAVNYIEDVQYHNLRTPEHPTKKNQSEVFAQVYDHHPHGDCDETPKELREYK